MSDLECVRCAKNKNKFNFNFFNRILVVLIIVGSVYYVAGINDLMVKGFKLEDMRKRSASLSNQNRELGVYMTSLKSYGNLVARVEKLNMVKIDKVDYLKTGTETVAVR